MFRKLFQRTVVAVCLSACSGPTGLKPFTSDGCTLFPDADLISHADWCNCCIEHDVAYWRGGTERERADADSQLRECVFSKSNNLALASLMYEGVRFGGSPYFYNWYRWAYGWPYERKYRALTAEEAQTAQRLLQQFKAEGAPAVCLSDQDRLVSEPN